MCVLQELCHRSVEDNKKRDLLCTTGDVSLSQQLMKIAITRIVHLFTKFNEIWFVGPLMIRMDTSLFIGFLQDRSVKNRFLLFVLHVPYHA